MRKTVEIVVIIVVALILAWGGYYLYSGKREAPKPPAPVEPGITPAAPAAATPAPETPVQASIAPSPDKQVTKERQFCPLFSGKILSHDGVPVKDVEIRLYRYSDLIFHFDPLDEKMFEAKPVLSARTSTDGGYSLTNLQPGIYRMELKMNESEGWWLQPQLSFKQGKPFIDFDITLKKTGIFEGTVVDPDNAPAPETLVTISSDQGIMKYYGRSLTNPDGSFRFASAPEGADLFLIARRQKPAPQFGFQKHVFSDSLAKPRLALTPGITVQGQIFIPGGKPASGADVFPYVVVHFTAEDKDKRMISFDPVRSNETGSFKMDFLPPGDLTLVVRGSGNEQLYTQTLTLASGVSPKDLSISLAEGKTISGVVLDDAGTSTPGAIVYYDNPSEERSIRTGAKGEFRLYGFGDKPVTLYAYADQTTLVKVSDVKPGTDRAIIKLHQGSSIEGAIRAKGDNRPLTLATFTLTRSPFIEPKRLTNKQGEFQAHFLPEEYKAKIYAACPGFAQNKGPELDLSPGKEFTGINFYLVQGASIAGHIFEEGSGRPVEYARIHDLDPHFFEPVFSDAMGYFRADHIPAGSESLEVSAEGYIKPRARRFMVQEGDEITSADFYLVREAKISGHVKNTEGEPVRDASIKGSWGMLRHINVSAQTSASSNEKGEYTLKGLAPSEPVNLWASHEEYAPVQAGPFQLKPGEHRENVDIVLTQGGSISGKIMDEKGAALPKAQVASGTGIGKFIGASFGTVIGMLEGGKFISADEEGRYEIKHLSTDKYYVLARAEGYVYDLRQDVPVQEGKPTQGIDFKLKTSVVLAGHVKNDKGDSIPEARVIALGLDFQTPLFAHDTSDRNGYFRIDGLAPRGYMVMVEKDPYPMLQKMNVPAPDENLELILESGGAIRGVALDNKTKKPVESYHITAEFTSQNMFGGQMMGNDQRLNRSTDVNSPEGVFELTGLKEGKYTLKVRAAGYSEGTKSGVKVENLKTVENVQISLKKGSTARGQVVRVSDKSPVSGAVVKISEGGGNLMGFDQSMFEFSPLDNASITDSKGNFTFDNLPSGLTTLQASKQGFLDGKKMIFILEGQDQKDVVIELASGGTVKGRVVAKGSNEPVKDAEVTFSGQGFVADLIPFIRKNTSTDANGNFEFAPVPPGNQTLKILHEQYSGKIIENLIIEEGKILDLGEIALDRGGGIAGFVMDVSGKPIAGAMLMLNGPSGMKQSNTNAEGEYSFNELIPGNYSVSLIGDQSRLMMGETGNVQEKQAGVEDGKITELNFILSPGYTLSGHVTKAGKPSTDVNVTYGSADPLRTSGEGANQKVDQEGKYQFQEVQPGKYNIAVYRGTMQPGAGMKPLFNSPLEITKDTVFDISLPVASVAGQARDAETREPIAGARIAIVRSTDAKSVEDVIMTGRWGELTDTTDDAGFYKLDELQSGDMTVVATHDKYAYAMQVLNLPEGEEKAGVDFELSPGLSLSCRAILRETGTPPSRLFVQLTNSQGLALYSQYPNVDGDGRFTIPGLREGEYVMHAFPLNAAPLYRIPCSVTVGMEEPLQLVFPVGGALIVDVADEAGNPVKKAMVNLLDSSGRALSFPPSLDSLMEFNKIFFTDEKGHLERRNIPEGTYTLNITATGFQPHSSELSISEDSPTPCKIQMKP